MTNRASNPYRKTTIATGLMLALLAGSCSANQTPADPPRKTKLAPAENQPTAAPMVKSSTPTPLHKMKKMNKQEQILFAREDLAKRVEIKLEDVKLSGFTPVTWRSGAMGCPKPGMEYTQALIPGVLIMLRIGHTAYRYHSIPSGEPFYCADNMAESPYTNSGDA